MWSLRVNFWGVFLSLVTAVTATSTLSSSSNSSNKTFSVVNVTSNCTAEELRVRVELNRKFKGLIYAKGFPLEKKCQSVGTNENFIDIVISTSSCGVRLTAVSEDVLSLAVTLNAQMDRYLQQIKDVEITATCRLTPNDMVHTKHAEPSRHTSRTGRYHENGMGALRDDSTLRSIRTWMEIEGTSAEGTSNRVYVGQQTLLLVKSILPDEYAANVVDCYAHDGTKESTQRLLDEFGCPLDESIMPSLEKIKLEDDDETWEEDDGGASSQRDDDSLDVGSKLKRERTGSGRPAEDDSAEVVTKGSSQKSDDQTEPKMKMQVIGTMFYAFKFPDTSMLHLKCVLQICKLLCPSVSCQPEVSNEIGLQNRTSKSVKSSDFSSVLDRIEVFNSVEVLAPGIDSGGYSSPEDEGSSKGTSGEKTFCLSASKMAFSFAILGAIFLCGVLAVLWTIMRNQIRRMNKSYDGSEQILVVRDSPFNLHHFRNKPFTSWSYT